MRQRPPSAGWQWGIAICRAYLGRSLLMQRRIDDALEDLRIALDTSRAVGDPFTGALSLSFYGVAVGARGQYREAAECLAESLTLFRLLGSLAQQSRVEVDWAALAIRHRQYADAVAALSDGLTTARRLGPVPYQFAQLLLETAELAASSDRPEDAAKLVGAAQALRTASGTHLPPEREQEELLLLSRIGSQTGASDLENLLSAGGRLDLDHATALAEALLDELGTAAC